MNQKNKLTWAPIAMLLAVLLLSPGCNKPTAEMERAEAAVSRAQREGAAHSAASLLAGAESALAEGKDLMDRLQYKQARASFEEAYRLALKAKDVAHHAAPGAEPKIDPPTAKPGANALVYTVTPGDCLWRISGRGEVYADPFQWPLIYDANRARIDAAAHEHGRYRHEEDWIYPGQALSAPMNSSIDEIKKARKKAGAPAPYLPPGH